MAARALFLFLALSACGAKGEVNLTTPDQITIYVDKFIPYECGTPPGIDKFQHLEVIFERGFTDTGQAGFILTGPQYENLGINTARTIKGIQQLKKQRDFYKDCVERSQE